MLKVHFARACAFGLIISGQATWGAALPSPGHLLVADSQNSANGIILDINRTTGAQSVWASGGFLDQPTDMVVDGQGNLVVSDFLNGIFKINPVTKQQTLISSGGFLQGTSALMLAPDGSIIAVNQIKGSFGQSPTVVRVNAVTGAQTLISGGEVNSTLPLTQPEGAIIGKDGNYLIDNYNGALSGVVKVNATSGAQSALTSGTYFANSLVFGIWQEKNNASKILVSEASLVNQSLSGLVEVDEETGAQTMISQGGGLKFPVALAQDQFGATFVSSADTSKEPWVGSIYQVDLGTGAQSLISTGNHLMRPQAILADSSVPEPGALAILGLGMGLLLMRRRVQGGV